MDEYWNQQRQVLKLKPHFNRTPRAAYCATNKKQYILLSCLADNHFSYLRKGGGFI